MDSNTHPRTSGALKVLAFIAATLLATGLLVAAGLGDGDPGPRMGWFDVSSR